MNFSRALPIVSLVFPVVYMVCIQFHWELFVYYPAVKQVHRFVDRSLGPAMFWYGWLFSASLISIAIGLLASFLPETKSKVVPTLLWVLPIVALGYVFYKNLQWFT